MDANGFLSSSLPGLPPSVPMIPPVDTNQSNVFSSLGGLVEVDVAIIFKDGTHRRGLDAQGYSTSAALSSDEYHRCRGTGSVVAAFLPKKR